MSPGMQTPMKGPESHLLEIAGDEETLGESFHSREFSSCVKRKS